MGRPVASKMTKTLTLHNQTLYSTSFRRHVLGGGRPAGDK